MMGNLLGKGEDRTRWTVQTGSLALLAECAAVSVLVDTTGTASVVLSGSHVRETVCDRLIAPSTGSRVTYQYEPFSQPPLSKLAASHTATVLKSYTLFRRQFWSGS